MYHWCSYRILTWDWDLVHDCRNPQQHKIYLFFSDKKANVVKGDVIYVSVLQQIISKYKSKWTCNSAYRITCDPFTHVGIFCVSYSLRMVSFVWVPQLQLNHCKFQPNLHNVLLYLISAKNLNYPSPGNWIIHPLIHSWYWVVVHPAQVINFCLNNQIR